MRFFPLVLLMVLALFFWRGLSLNPHELPSAQIGHRLPAFKLPDLEHTDLFLQTNHLAKKPFLLNVWASWCQACITEQIMLLHLADQGITIYGLNYKDDPEQAKAWLARWGNPYQQIGMDKTGRVAVDLGTYGAPETFVVDRQGIIRYRHAGVLTETIWRQKIQPLLHQLEHS